MHRHVLGAGRDHHQHAQQCNHRNSGLSLVQGLFIGLGKLRNIAGVGDQLAPYKGEVQGTQDADTDAEGSDAEESEGSNAQFTHYTVGRGVGADTHQGHKASKLSAEQQGEQSLGGTNSGGDAHGGNQGHHTNIAAYRAEGAGHNQCGKNDIPFTFTRYTNHLFTNQIGDAGVEQGRSNHHHTSQKNDSCAVIAGKDIINGN